jgi:Tfp pilus assembly protein FimT
MEVETGNRGFTVLEVCMVAGLIGIVALLSIHPMKTYLRRLEFRNSEKNIKRLIQTAQSRAMANPNLHIGIRFDLAATPQRAFAFQDRANPELYQYDGDVDSAYLQPELLKRGASFEKVAGYPSEIIFRGDGSAYKSIKMVLTEGVLRDTLDVLASTGRVRLGQ